MLCKHQILSPPSFVRRTRYLSKTVQKMIAKYLQDVAQTRAHAVLGMPGNCDKNRDYRIRCPRKDWNETPWMRCLLAQLHQTQCFITSLPEHITLSINSRLQLRRNRICILNIKTSRIIYFSFSFSVYQNSRFKFQLYWNGCYKYYAIFKQKKFQRAVIIVERTVFDITNVQRSMCNARAKPLHVRYWTCVKPFLYNDVLVAVAVVVYLRLVLTSDGVGVIVVIGIVRALTT